MQVGGARDDESDDESDDENDDGSDENELLTDSDPDN